MPTAVTRYKCDHRDKHYSTKWNSKRHEDSCFFNPAVKSCVTCDWSIDPAFHEEISTDYCKKMKREIFMRGKSVLKCPGWAPKVQEVVDDEV